MMPAFVTEAPPRLRLVTPPPTERPSRRDRARTWLRVHQQPLLRIGRTVGLLTLAAIVVTLCVRVWQLETYTRRMAPPPVVSPSATRDLGPSERPPQEHGALLAAPDDVTTAAPMTPEEEPLL